MSLLTKLFRRNSPRAKALSKYRSGMELARGRKYELAVAEYSSAIELLEVPQDVKAMATYNRSIAYSLMGKESLAAQDLASVLEMEGVPENIRLEARQRQGRMKKRQGARES